jgi:anti-sigma factor RsiW
MLTPIPPTECSRARESTSAQLDGELSELGSARLSAHLRDCPACAAYALELGAIAARLRAAALEQPARPIELPQRLRRFQVTARAAAAAVAVAAGASLALGHALGSGSSRPSAARATVREPIPTSVVRGLRADAVAVPSVIPARGRRMGQTVVL